MRKSQWLLHDLILFISLMHSSSYAVAGLSENRQIFSIFDVSLRLLWVPEPMNDSVKESFVTACRVFLEGHLNVAPTTIINLQVAVGSQELDNLHSVTDDSVFPLSANIEVLVEYFIDPGNANLGEIERRIKTLFVVEWEELLALLLLLNPDYFSPIRRIFLEASIDPIAPAPSPPVTLERSETNAASSTIVVVFTIVAVGVFVSLAMTIPVFLKQSKSRNLGCNPTITTSSTNEEGTQSRDGGKSVLSSEMEYTNNRKDVIQSIYSEDKISSYSLRNLRSQKSNSQDKFQQTMSGFKSAFRISSSEGPPRKEKQSTEKPSNAAKRADVEISRVSTQSSTENQSLDDHTVPVIPFPAVPKPIPVAPKPALLAPQKGNSQDECQQTRSGFKSAFRIPSGEGLHQKEMPPTEKPQKAKAAKRADVQIWRVSTQSSTGTQNQSLEHPLVPLIPIPALSKPVPVASKPAPAVSKKPQVPEVQPPSQPTPVVPIRQKYHLPPVTIPYCVSSDATNYSMSTISYGGADNFDEEEGQPGTLLEDDRTIETIQTTRRAAYTSSDDFGSIAGSLPKPKKAARKRVEGAWSRDIQNGIVLQPRNKPTHTSPEQAALSKVVGSVIRTTAPRLKLNLSTHYSADADEDDDFGSIAGSLPKPDKCTRRHIDL